MRNKTSLIFLLVFFSISAIGQEVTIKGKVLHPEDPTFNLLIVNQTTSRGSFGEVDGTFEIKADKSDTVLIGALGYRTQKICMADSNDQDEYFVRLSVARLAYELKTVTIMPQRELDSIQKDIRNLGYDDRDYMLSGIDAIHSPLTFLYQQVSRQERMKRNAYQVINEDRRRDLLKELFVKYVSYDIIDLRKDQFEDFIDFMDISEGQMKSMTQYEFVVFTKQRYQQFKNTPVRLRQDIDIHD